MKLIRTSYDLPEELHQKFKEVCVTKKVNMNFIIREIMNKWLMEQENKKGGKE